MAWAASFIREMSRLSLANSLSYKARSECAEKFLNRYHINLQFLSLISTRSLNIDDLPARPKKPATAFIKYTLENRQDEKYQGYKLTEVTKQLGIRWKEMNDNEKQVYVEKYKEELKAYSEEFKIYKNSLTKDEKERLKEYRKVKKQQKEKLKSRKLMKSLNKPRRSCNSYAHFVQSESMDKTNKDNLTSVFNSWFKRSSNSSLPNPKTNWTDLSIKWKNLAPDQKKQYEEMAALDSARYISEMKEWKAKMEEEGHIDLFKKKTKSKKK